MATIRRFRQDRGGNFALFAALGAVPLIFAVGAGLDASRLASAKKHLQAAVDAAALSVVKTSGFDPAKANDIADRMIRSNYGDGFQAMQIDFTPSGARVSAETVVPTTLTAILGYQQFTAKVSGTVEYPQTKYEVVLVLDTTGSMKGAKLAEMKQAAKDMVDALSSTPILRERVRFALVPFSTYVNVGPDKVDAGWIDRDGLVQMPGSIVPAGVSRLRIFQSGFRQKWAGCVETRIEDGAFTYSVDDTTPKRSMPRTLFTPMLAPDEPESGDYRNSYVTEETLKGLGVTLSKGRPSYALALVEELLGSLFFPGNSQRTGPNAGCVSRPIVALTDETTAVKAEIEALVAEGTTNITEGMAWGARVLSPGAPFSEGAAPSEEVEKIVVLLTDGDNTLGLMNNDKGSEYSSYGYVADGRWDESYKAVDGQDCDSTEETEDDDDDNNGGGNNEEICAPVKSPAEARAVTPMQVTAEMNEDTAAACDKAKLAGTEIYTIRLEVATVSSSTLLSNCATDEDHYYDAKTAAELGGIFDDIVNRILRLKITS